MPRGIWYNWRVKGGILRFHAAPLARLLPHRLIAFSSAKPRTRVAHGYHSAAHVLVSSGFCCDAVAGVITFSRTNSSQRPGQGRPPPIVSYASAKADFALYLLLCWLAEHVPDHQVVLVVSSAFESFV